MKLYTTPHQRHYLHNTLMVISLRQKEREARKEVERLAGKFSPNSIISTLKKKEAVFIYAMLEKTIEALEQVTIPEYKTKPEMAAELTKTEEMLDQLENLAKLLQIKLGVQE